MNKFYEYSLKADDEWDIWQRFVLVVKWWKCNVSDHEMTFICIYAVILNTIIYECKYLWCELTKDFFIDDDIYFPLKVIGIFNRK